MSNTDELIEKAEGTFTPEEAAQLIELELNGDTGKQPELGTKPDVPADDDGVKGKADDSNLNAENAVVLTRDGKHTINYEVLQDARKAAAQERALREQREAALTELSQKQQEYEAELARLRAKAESEAAGGSAKPNDGGNDSPDDQSLSELFGDFSEESIANAVKELVRRETASAEGRIAQQIKPLKEREAVDAVESHNRQILEAHPDAASIVESQELSAWVNSAPSYAQAGIKQVLAQGSAGQIVELLDRFKAETGVPSGQGDIEKMKLEAKRAVANAGLQAPATLSDIRGGRAGGGSSMDELDNKTPAELADTMMNWTSEQIERYLNRHG